MCRREVAPAATIHSPIGTHIVIQLESQGNNINESPVWKAGRKASKQTFRQETGIHVSVRGGTTWRQRRAVLEDREELSDQTDTLSKQAKQMLQVKSFNYKK